MRLLFLAPFAPRLDATNGCSRIIAQILSRLAIHHKLCLVYLRGETEPPIDDHILQCCDWAVEVFRPWSGSSFFHKWARRYRLMTSLIGSRPMWVTDWYSSDYARKVKSAVQRWQPDVLQIESHVMGQYLPAIRACKVPCVLNVHEPGERAAPFIFNTNPILSLINTFDRLAWRRYEQAVVHQVETIVVFTDQDKGAIERLNPISRIVKIPIGTEIPTNTLPTNDDYPPRLLFFGSFIHPPNIDAALRLAQSIFPPILARIPDLELYIVGDQPPPVLKRIANDKIIVTGQVPSLTPYFDQASIVVAPLRLGGGMRVKILETLAAGKALVATPLAIEGLELTDHQQVVLAESDEDFVHAIINLLANSEMRSELAKRARAWARENLTWDTSINSYEALYTDLIENHRQS